MNQQQLQPLTNITEIHEKDVLCGRGVHARNHPGNRYFVSLVKDLTEEFAIADKNDKRRYAETIVSIIRSQDPPGRFLKRNSQKESAAAAARRRDRGAFGGADEDYEIWDDIGDKQAVTKARQALCDSWNKTVAKDEPGEAVGTIDVNTTKEGRIFNRLKAKAKVVVDVSTSSKVSIKEVEEPNDNFSGDISKLRQSFAKIEAEMVNFKTPFKFCLPTETNGMSTFRGNDEAGYRDRYNHHETTQNAACGSRNTKIAPSPIKTRSNCTNMPLRCILCTRCMSKYMVHKRKVASCTSPSPAHSISSHYKMARRSSPSRRLSPSPNEVSARGKSNIEPVPLHEIVMPSIEPIPLSAAMTTTMPPPAGGVADSMPSQKQDDESFSYLYGIPMNDDCFDIPKEFLDSSDTIGV